MKREEREAREGLPDNVEATARAIVDAGLKVHRLLGPGLLESVYEHCLVHELEKREMNVRRQVILPILYDGDTLDAGYRLDLVVEDSVIVEIKSVTALSRLHEAQVLTYLRLSGMRLAFVMNFNVPLFKEGLKRYVRSAPSPSRPS
jgi:GxxExxY protein